MIPRSVIAAAAVLAVYAGTVAWLTWPLAAHLTTHLPNTWMGCRTDAPLIAWALAHQSHALVTSPWELPHGNVFHPEPHSLFYGEAGFGAVPYFLPTFLLTGNPALALNVTFLGSVALTAWALHLVVLRWTGSHLGGFVAGCAFLMTHFVLWTRIPSAPNYGVLVYFPFIVLLAATPPRRFRATLPLLLLLVLQCLTSLYVTVAAMVPLGILAVVRLLRPPTRRAGLRMLAMLGCAVLIVVVVYSGYLMADSRDVILEGRPLERRTHLEALFKPPDPSGIPGVSFLIIFVGALSFLSRRDRSGRRHPAWSHSTFWAVVGVLISFSTIVTWQGSGVELPHAALAQVVPIYRAIRFPSRLRLAALIGLCLLTGIAFAECARRVGALPRLRNQRELTFIMRTVLAAIVAVAMYASYARGITARFHVQSPLPHSYPIKRVMDPESPLNQLLRKPGGPLLELPVGAGPVIHADAMYRSIFHHRPILNGYSGYRPPRFAARMELACRLPDRDALDALRRETGLEMILVRLASLQRRARWPGPYACPPETGVERRVWLELADNGREDLRLVARDRFHLLFSVAESASLRPDS